MQRVWTDFAVLPLHVRGDAHLLQRAVARACARARRAGSRRGQPRRECRRRCRCRRGTRRCCADVLLGRVAEELELGAVHAQDLAVAIDPMQRIAAFSKKSARSASLSGGMSGGLYSRQSAACIGPLTCQGIPDVKLRADTYHARRGRRQARCADFGAPFEACVGDKGSRKSSPSRWACIRTTSRYGSRRSLSAGAGIREGARHHLGGKQPAAPRRPAASAS